MKASKSASSLFMLFILVLAMIPFIPPPEPGSQKGADASRGIAQAQRVAPQNLTYEQGSIGGKGHGSFSRPQGVAVDRNGSVYVVDRMNGRVQKFDRNGTLQGAFQITAKQPPAYNTDRGTGLTGIAVDKNGFIYVSDPTVYGGNGLIWKLYPNGTVAQNWGVPGRGFDQLGGLAVDDKGFLYLAVRWTYGPSSGVAKYHTHDGSPAARPWTFGAYGSDSPYHQPIGIVYDGSGSLYVAAQGLFDSRNNWNFPPRIVKLDADSGAVVQSWNLDRSALPSLTGIAIGANGSLYLSDPLRAQTFKFNPQTGNVTTLMNFGRYAAPFWIAGNATAGIFYVSDENLDKVYKISTVGRLLATLGRSSLHGEIMVAADANNFLLVADGGSGLPIPLRVSRFDPDGNLLARWHVSVPGNDLNSFYSQGIFLDSAGNILILINPARAHSGRSPVTLLKYDLQGKLLTSTSFPDFTSLVTVDGQGNVYAIVGGKLISYNPSFAPAGNWSAPAYPRGIAFYKNSVFVLTGEKDYETRVVKYSLKGDQLAIFPVNRDLGRPIDGISNLAVDTRGNLYVWGYLSGSIWVFGSDGDPVAEIRTSCPRAVAASISRLYISTRCGPGDNMIYVFELVSISGTLADTRKVAVPNVRITAVGMNGVTWSAVTDTNGGYFLHVPAGKYILVAIPPQDSKFEVQWYQNQTSPHRATVIIVPPSLKADFTLQITKTAPVTVSVAGSIPGPLSRHNVHEPLEFSREIKDDEYFISGTIIATYSDGTLQTAPMNLTSAYLGSLRFKIAGKLIPLKGGKALITIQLECPSTAKKVFEFGVGMISYVGKWITEGSVSYEINGAWIPKSVGGVPTGAGGLLVNADKLASLVGRFAVSVLEANEINNVVRNFINSPLNTPGTDPYIIASSLISPSGTPGIPNVKNVEGAHTLLYAIVSYLTATGKLNGFTPAYPNPNPQLPPIIMDEDYIKTYPWRYFDSVIRGYGYNAKTGRFTDRWWQDKIDQPLNAQDYENIQKLMKWVNHYFSEDGSFKKDCAGPLKSGFQTETLRVEFVDPSGIITDAITSSPIQGATVTLYRLNVTTSKFQRVGDPALFTPSTNPQRTDSRGAYGWDVVPGTYYVSVEGPGYYPANSSVVTVPPPVTDLNVKLTPLPQPKTTLALTDGTLGNNGWYISSSVLVTLNTRDNAGLRSMHYIINDQSEVVVNLSGANVSSRSFTLSGDGVHAVKYWSVGAHGFVEKAKSQFVAIDSTPPILLINITGTGTSVVPSIFAYDATSGLFNSTAVLNGSPYSMGTQIHAIGTHTLSVVATDFAGNRATKSATFNVESISSASTPTPPPAPSPTPLTTLPSPSAQTPTPTQPQAATQPSGEPPTSPVLIIGVIVIVIMVIVLVALGVRKRRSSTR